MNLSFRSYSLINYAVFYLTFVIYESWSTNMTETIWNWNTKKESLEYKEVNNVWKLKFFHIWSYYKILFDFVITDRQIRVE